MSDAAAEAPPPAEAASELKYRGVRKRKWGKYVSEIRLPNSRERIWLGSYDMAEKAARAFDAALFCLRGRAANFNFPDDPPDIAGGRSLSPAEIQVVAQRYGNNYDGGPMPRAAAFGGDDSQFRGRALEDVATTSSGFDGFGPVDLTDISFWEMMDMNGGGWENNAGYLSGFGLFPEPGESYGYTHYEARVYENDEDECYDHVLWNF